MRLPIKITRRRLLKAKIGLVMSLACHKSASADSPTTESFILVERLGRNWRSECVRFPISSEMERRALAGEALVDESGQPTPFELIDGEGGKAIEFIADLPKLGQSSYRLSGAVEPARSDVTVAESPDEIRLTNARGGVAIRTRLVDRDGPIRGLLTPEGIWVGSSLLPSAEQPVASYVARVERRGPVAASVLCLTHFTSGVTWSLRLTLQAHDPVILIEELWSNWDHARFELGFDSDFPITQLYFRKGAGGHVGQVAIAPFKPEQGDIAFALEPWLHWWIDERRGNWVTLHSESTANGLLVATLRADKWIEPGDVALKRKLEPVKILFREDRTTVSLPQTGSTRIWMMAILPRSEAVDLSLVGKRIAPPAQYHVVRHGDFPLDRVRQLTLAWQQASPTRQRLVLTAKDVARLERRGAPSEEEMRKLEREPLNEFNLAGYVEAFLRSGDARLGHKLSRAALMAMQDAVDYFLDQHEQLTLGFAPHQHRLILYAVYLADLAMADAWLDEPARKQILYQAAFLSDIVHRPDYWSPERSFGANPNMSSMVAGYQGLLACLLYDHPNSKAWLDAALAELVDKELLTWSDENGGWLEAPHYAMASFDHLLGVFVAVRNLGQDRYLFHPRMRKVIEWLAKITTPPDVRIGGRRHKPPIGNTYMLEPTGEFGTVAQIWRDRDPAFSSEMQWMHQQSGNFILPGVGGFAQGLGPYQTVLKDPELPARRPDYRSELFPETGAILRAHFGTDRETQLHIIAGLNHEHYDYDSGSVTIWGLGRLIADDFGYYGRAPASDHSMVESEAAAGVAKVERFWTSDVLDIVRIRAGAWTRQIAFLKDRDPIGANFFVIRDEVAGKADAKWRLYLSAERLEMTDNRIVAIGHDDVDTYIVFLEGRPRDLVIEAVTRTSSSSFFDKPYATTQIALVAGMAPENRAITVLIYPRLKGTASPSVSTTASGRVVDVGNGNERRTVFIARDPFEHVEGKLTFRGTMGVVISLQDAEIAALGEAGSINMPDRELNSTVPAVREWSGHSIRSELPD